MRLTCLKMTSTGCHVGHEVYTDMRRVHVLSEIGYCQTQFDAMVRHMMSYGPDDLSSEDVEHPDSALNAEKKATLSRNKVYP